MLKIYINTVSNQKLQQEVEFANYLVMRSEYANRFFKRLCKKHPDELREKYIKYFNSQHAIFIPKRSDNVSLSYSEKHFLKHPESIYNYPSQFSSFGELIVVQDATLVSLDKELSACFRTGYNALDRIFILNADPRLFQYEDIVYGINSPKISYKDKNLLSNFRRIIENNIRNVLGNMNVGNVYSTYFNLGTTALPTGGVKSEKH